MSNVVQIHENKSNPTQIPYNKIVEAYGLRKCPKLVEQVAGDDLDVRVCALKALCDEFNNPFSIYGCGNSGVIKVLSAMVTDPDYTTRDRASKALALAAADANGLKQILADNTIAGILHGINDPSEDVRANVYDCLEKVTRTTAGVEACVQAAVPTAFVIAVIKEDVSLKPVILKAIHNICGSEMGLTDSLESKPSSVVKVCIDLLLILDKETSGQAARTLGFICMDEKAKEEALAGNAIAILLEFLGDQSRSIEAKAAGTMALMAITSTDEGKRQIHSCKGQELLVSLLLIENKVLRLNVLKVISNAVVFPAFRSQLLLDIHTIKFITSLTTGKDELIKRHATICLNAINWIP